MAFDGSGNFLRIHNWQQDAANGIDISAPEMDGEDNGFAAGLTLAVTRDGQGKMAADLLPSAASTYNCGSASFPWLAGNFGSLNVAGSPVYAGAPVNLQAAAAYTLVIGDANKTILGTFAGVKTFTIPSNASVPFAIGTMVTFVTLTTTMNIQITTDNLNLAGVGTTGTRTLGIWGIATILKITANTWLISGIGLS